MAKHHTATVLLLLCCAALTAQARLLQQATPNARCPAGCADGACVLDSTSGGYKCTACKGSLVVNPDDGTCGCPAGRFGTTDTCQDCDKSYYCAGGTYTAPNVPAQVACPNSLTTIGKRSTSVKACVNLPGRFYTVDGVSGEPGQTTCPVDTYGPGLRKQRACVPCPPGFSTKGLTGKTSSRDCYVPPGFYLKGPGQVSPCPKGEYKSGYDAVAACSKCAEGVTTLAEASTNQAACVSVLPTYYPASIQTLVVDSVNVGDYVATTKKCPQKFYCPGGEPSAAFSPSSPTSLSGTTVVACPKQTWTEGTGASDATQCMTPPGYKTVGDVTDACDAGSYRAEWKPADQAGSCDLCGDNILSDPTDEITSIDISDYTSTSKVFVRASASACYIKPGQGMYFSPATSKYTAVNCDTNNYGVADKTFGLAAYPCRDCPSGMQTSVSLTNSNSYKADNGFTSPMACVTKAGYGYNGRVANKCPAGSYNAAGNYGTCTQCPVGYSTPDAAESQVSQSDCAIAVGYGFYNNAVIPCPVGTYNSELRNTNSAACDACPSGLTTSQAGGRSVADCNVCQPGYGGDACGTPCGGSGVNATFGIAGRPVTDSQCDACPTMSTGFSFDYLAVNQPFTPAPVARVGAASAADCLAEFAQVADGAWYMGGSAALTNLTGSIADTFDACVAACKADATCQYVTYDYDAKACFQKSVGAASATGDVLAFKAVVAGDTTAASKSTDAKALASGSYTFWKETAAGVGASSTAGPTGSLQACLSACDADAACAAVAISGATSDAAAAISGCSLIKGDSRVAQFKRSVTKAVASKLAVSTAL